MTQRLFLFEHKHNFYMNIRQQVSCAVLTSAHTSVFNCSESLSDIVSEGVLSLGDLNCA